MLLGWERDSGVGVKVTNWTKLICSVRSQDSVYPWGIVTRRGTERLVMLFLDPDAGYTRVFNLRKLIELYMNYFSTLCMHIIFQEKKFNAQERED